jgi:hypothetical protein
MKLVLETYIIQISLGVELTMFGTDEKKSKRIRTSSKLSELGEEEDSICDPQEEEVKFALSVLILSVR